MPDSEAVQGGDLLTGTIYVIVRAGGDMRRAINFLLQLRRQPQVRLLMTNGSPVEGDIVVTLGLREPLALRTVIERMDGVLKTEGVAQSVAADGPTMEAWLVDPDQVEDPKALQDLAEGPEVAAA